MLSTKFKVSFVKLSLEISRSLKDILHTVVTSNLIIISHEKSLMCWKIKMGSGWVECECVFLSALRRRGRGFVIFRDALLCSFFFFHSCSLHISTDIKRHQIARNSPWLCMAVKRVAGILPSQKVRVEIRDKMPFEVDYSWEGSRSSFTHITRCCSPPFCSRLHWGEEAELFWVSHQPPRATLIFTSMQIQDVMVSLPRSPEKQR